MNINEDFKIKASKRAVEHGLKLGKKVYQDKLNFNDKWFLGGANELQADIYGFIAESIVCEYFDKPLPAFTPQENDEYDIVLGDLRIDVKKVGYSSNTKRPKITLNKKQFERKKKKIDAFLFCTFTGAFNQIQAGGQFQVFVPIPEISQLWMLGWIRTEEVEKRARTYYWKNKDGSVRDESWLLQQRSLLPIQELID